MLAPIKTLSGHQNPVYALANAEEAGVFYSAGNDKGVVEWSLANMVFVKVKMPVLSSVYSMAVHGNLLFVAERSGVLSIFDLRTEQSLVAVNAHKKPIFDIKIIRSKNEFLTASEDGSVAVWSLIDFREIYRFQVAYDTVRGIAVSADELDIAFCCKDHLVRIYNLADYSLKQSLEGHTFGVTSIAYDPNGKYLISGSRDAQLKVWSLPHYELTHSIPAHLFSIYSIVFHPTLPYFATCSRDKSIKLWDAENFKLYKNLSIEKSGAGHRHSVNKLIWSADGKYLISAGDDQKVMIWEM